MTKFILKTATGLLLFFSIFQAISFADFSDVFPAHKNYNAINYLQENNIVNGYPDGTFKPNQSVNRAEFLKIIIEGSKIETNISMLTPFNDVDHEAWYGPYVKHAYSTGWINGYADGSFKPGQTINKVEAIKILAKAQNWILDPFVDEQPFNDTPLSEWYIPYLSYAKEKNFLEETGSFFEPANLMTRAQISEIIYRTLIAQPKEEIAEKPVTEENSPPLSEEKQPIIEETETAFTPVSYEIIKNDFFENITLEESLPNTFYKNEVYIVKGTLNASTEKKVTIILNSEEDDEKEAFSGSIINNNFSIPIHFRKSGNYILGIIPGNSGSSKAAEISVLKDLPESLETTPSGNKASNLDINYENDKTSVTFNSPSPSIKKLTFTQDDKNISYLSRQNISKMEINYKDFANFKEESVNFQIETATLSSTKPLQIQTTFNSSAKKTFTATQHTFDAISEEDINSNPVDTLNSPQAISIKGTVKVKAKTKAYVTKPDGFVDEVILKTSATIENQLIPANGNFDFTYSIKNNDTYIFEINNENGEAIMNHPIYVGDLIPLIPDFGDLNEKELFTQEFNLSELQTELLNAINTDRKEHGLSEVTLSNELNDLAQAHSDDMKKNKYFGHNNLKGETPEDRRIAAGIKTTVGENLAKDTNISSAHYGLMRSGAHRKNILESSWTRLGIGIALEEGYLIVVEEFSTSEPTAGDIMKYKDEIFTEINIKRAENNKNSFSTTTNLNSTAKYLNDKNIIEGKSLSNQLFQEALELNNVTGTSQAIGRIYNIWSTILESILEDEADEILNSNWELLGIDIQLDSKGNINTIIILNNP